MTGFLQVETRDFAAAAATMSGHAGDPLQRAVLSLSDTLAASGAMAGSDAGGQQWAAAYDRAARSALQAGVGVTNACYRLASLFAQSARNYEAAEAASSWRGRAPAPPPLPQDTELFVYAVPPSAAGGTGGGPPGWGLVEHAVGYAWPNGHQDRLHATAAAWDACARHLADAAAWVDEVPWLFEHDGLPELADITAVCRGVHAHLTELSAVQHGLADACTELAHHLDTAHASVISELEWLLGESALLQAGGVLVSVFSAGTAEGAAQAAEAARVAKAAATVRRLLETFLAAVRAVTARVAALVDRAEATVARVQAIAHLRLAASTARLATRYPMIGAAGERAAALRLSLGLRGRVLTDIGDPHRFDPHALTGMTVSRVKASIPSTWERRAAVRGKGEVFVDPLHKGRQIRVMYGNSRRPNALKHGPYAVVSQNGDPVYVPLAGNGTLR